LLGAVRLLVPRLFDDRVGRFGRGQGSGGQAATSQHDAVVSALNVAMGIALLASLAVASVVAILVARRVLRPLDELRAATRRLAAGRYDTPVDPPREAELAALADDVNHLAAALAETEQRRAALIGDVAHEMRTPLTTITGYLEGFSDGMFSPEEMSATVADEVARLHRLARDLAAVSRVDERQLHLDLADEDLTEVVDTVVDRLRPQFVAKNVDLSVHTPGPVPVPIDRQRVIQAVTNLVGNALAYTPAGGAVTVSVTTQAGAVRLTVADTGRGLRSDELEHIFERFYRADPHDHSGGTGVGLTIARAIARAHHGDLTATSAGPGRGSSFELTLPAP
jgi:histidine kinase